MKERDTKRSNGARPLRSASTCLPSFLFTSQNFANKFKWLSTLFPTLHTGIKLEKIPLLRFRMTNPPLPSLRFIELRLELVRCPPSKRPASPS